MQDISNLVQKLIESLKDWVEQFQAMTYEVPNLRLEAAISSIKRKTRFGTLTHELGLRKPHTLTVARKCARLGANNFEQQWIQFEQDRDHGRHHYHDL
ncbi:hypothetical protein M5689_013763 [Euphorbia peplus]|nr:hypothetical protein M5689_013763 [Euphorbia peplus]